MAFEVDLAPNVVQALERRSAELRIAPERLVHGLIETALTRLTEFEVEVLSLTAQSLTVAEIARRLDISPQAVTVHLASAIDRLGQSGSRQESPVQPEAAPDEDSKAMSPTEIVQAWRSEGVIGSRPDIEDSAKLARELREKAQRRHR
jgi:DNA-binding CsgD family transcriptional regulator